MNPSKLLLFSAKRLEGMPQVVRKEELYQCCHKHHREVYGCGCVPSDPTPVPVTVFGYGPYAEGT